MIYFELISRYYNDLLADYFKVDKIRELIGRKYYWSSLKKNIKSYIKEYDICLALKTVKHKSYGDFWSLFVLIYW